MGRVNTLTQRLQFLSISRIAGAVLAGVVMVKMGWDAKTIGYYELLFFLGKATTAFWADALAKAILPSYAKVPAREKPQFFGSAALLYFALSLFTGVLLVIFKAPITHYFLHVEHLPYYYHYIAFLMLNIPGLFLEQYFTVKVKTRQILHYTILSYILYPVYFLVPIYLGYNLGQVLIVLSVVAFAKILWIGWILFKERASVSPVFLKKLIRISRHLAGYTLVGMMAEFIDGTIINATYKSPEIFAVFRYGAREFPLTTALVGGLSAASIAKFSEIWEAHLQDYKNSISRIIRISLAVAPVLMLLSPWLFTIVFSKEFYESAFVFNTYLLILAVRVLMPGPLLLAKLDSKFMFNVSMVELALNVVLSWVFIKYWGLIGVAWATVLSYYVEKVAYFFRLKQKYGIHPKQIIPANLYSVFWLALHTCYFLAWWLFRRP